jgi:hypothetical protein
MSSGTGERANLISRGEFPVGKRGFFPAVNIRKLPRFRGRDDDWPTVDIEARRQLRG